MRLFSSLVLKLTCLIIKGPLFSPFLSDLLMFLPPACCDAVHWHGPTSRTNFAIFLGHLPVLFTSAFAVARVQVGRKLTGYYSFNLEPILSGAVHLGPGSPIGKRCCQGVAGPT